MAIVASSFRLVAARLIPRLGRCKQALLLVVILSGCGGGGHPQARWETVSTPAYRFEAPLGWRVRTTRTLASAGRDSELVQVATFPLVRAYSSTLFTAVQTELATRMAAVAKETGGSVAGHSVVTAAGIRAHSYGVRVGDHVDEYTFVLRGKREYQLLCRRKSSDHSRFCERLIASFSLA